MRQPVLVAGGDKGAEERMRLEGLGLELRVKLAAYEERVARDLDNFDIGGVGGSAGDLEACPGEDGFVFTVEFIAVAVAFADLGGPVSFGRQGAGFHSAGPGSEAHGAAHLFDPGEFAELIDDAVRGGGIEFAGVRILQAADIARVLDARSLHAEADAKVGNLFFAGVADGVEHAFDTAFAEAAGDEDAVEAS